MKTVEFYRGECGNSNGHTLAEIMTWDYDNLEMDHEYIQWVFPNNQPSMFNSDAPVMTLEESKIFKADPELQESVKQFFIKFLGFLGFELVIDLSNEGREILIRTVQSSDSGAFGNPWWWLKPPFNHNILRITRILRSLRLVGLERYAYILFNTLYDCSVKNDISNETWKHWNKAVFDPLW